MAKPYEYTLFLAYTDEIKKFLVNNVYLKKYPKDENVQVFFATPPMAFAKFLVPVINGANLNPTVSFYLSNIEYVKEQNLNGFTKLPVRQDKKFIYESPFLIYQLTYKINILTTIEREADIIETQILLKTPFNRPHPFKIFNNQWGTIYSQNTSNDTELAPGEAKDKIISRSLDLVIPRSYFPKACEIFDGIIEEISVAYERKNRDKL
jgi:hypothetical protein